MKQRRYRVVNEPHLRKLDKKQLMAVVLLGLIVILVGVAYFVSR